MASTPIRHWPADERPREKLARSGADSLSDAELLAIFLRTGTTGKSAVELGRELLNQFGGLRQILNAEQSTLAFLGRRAGQVRARCRPPSNWGGAISRKNSKGKARLPARNRPPIF